jgi:hypothetical protein
MNPLVKDFITKRRMPGAELLEETDDIETPYGSIARDSADIDPEAIGASPALSPEMVQSSNDSNLMSNMGRALSSLAAGGTKVADNSDLFTAMDAQTKQRDAMAGADLNRSAAVKKAIMASKAREAAQAQALGFKEKQLEESMRHHKAMEAASNATRAATFADRQDRKTERQEKTARDQATAEEKKRLAMAEVVDRRDNILDNVNLVQKMIDEDGTWEVLGSHNQDLERRIEAIATDMAKLQDPSSVARPSEVEAVKQNLVKSGFKNSNATAKQIMENFKKEVEARAQNAFRVRGLSAPKAPTHAPGSVVEVRGKKYRVGADGDSLEEIGGDLP